MQLLIAKDGSMNILHLNIDSTTPVLYMPKKGRVMAVYFGLPDNWNEYRQFHYIGFCTMYDFYEEKE